MCDRRGCCAEQRRSDLAVMSRPKNKHRMHDRSSGWQKRYIALTFQITLQKKTMINIPKFFKNDDSQATTLILPLLPLRDIVVFPHMVAPLFVGRAKSVNALADAMNQDKNVFLSTQKKARDRQSYGKRYQHHRNHRQRSAAAAASGRNGKGPG